MEKTDYDVIIVSTGPGGGSVLWLLAEQWGNNGKQNGVIEAGMKNAVEAIKVSTIDPICMHHLG